MMAQSSISNEQRFTKYGLHCPICGGHRGEKPGKGTRCAGYEIEDGEYVFCTREEYAGNLEAKENTTPRSFCHKMYGPCNCGKEHNPARATNGHKPNPKEKSRIEYSYQDASGRLAYKVVRFEPKDFRQCRPDGKGGWEWNMQGATYVPYRLPDLLRNREATVYIVEGEKDADNLAHAGLVATTNVQGAGKWRKEYNQYLKGRHVVILPDNDKPGREHAESVKSSLQEIAASVRIIQLPDLPAKGDVSDWLAAGGTREKLEALCKPQKRKFTYASEVTEQSIEWVWENRIAKGCFTLAVGDAGVGKGLTLMALIRAVTRGESLPGGPAIAPGGVILMSPEDPTSRVLIPRLKASGADLTKVLLLSEIDEVDINTGETYQRPVSFPEDAHILREAIEDAGACLVIIDPVLSLLSGKIDAHKNHAVRHALAHVVSTADKHGCAVLGVMHTTKAQNPNVLFRSSSSSAFIEMARAALFFVPDPEGEQGQSGVIVNYKNNLSRYASSIRYSIHQNERKIGYINWQGESTYSRDELLNQSTPTNNKKSEHEEDIITILKSNGEAMTTKEISSHTKQDFEALRKILQRKADAGTIWRTSRGKYTYVGNPLYKDDVTNVPSVPNVTSVPNVPNDERDIERDMNGTHVPNMSQDETASEASSVANNGKRDIWDIHSSQESLKFTQPLYNDGPKDALEAARYHKRWVNTPFGYGQIIFVNEHRVDVDIMGKIHSLRGVQIPQIEVKEEA